MSLPKKRKRDLWPFYIKCLGHSLPAAEHVSFERLKSLLLGTCS